MSSVKWGLHWTFVAFGAAVVRGLSPGRHLELFEMPARTAARAGTVLAAVALATPVVFAIELTLSAAEGARREYSPSDARKIIRFETSVVLAGTLLYSAFALWALRLTWRTADRWTGDVRPVAWEPSKPSWRMALLLIVASVAVGYYLIHIIRGTVRNYAKSLRDLGVRRFLRGVPLMILLRLRQPRRDFFMHTPVIGEMWIFAICAGLAAAIPIPAFAIALPSMMATVAILMMLDKLRPPTLLFLGASEYESFRAFYILRLIWGPTAVTLLDRENESGQRFYHLQRDFWSHHGSVPSGLFYDPTVPRVWSLRTRPALWGRTVLRLIDYVPAVVVDVRYASDYVRDEVVSLAQVGRIEKTWFLMGDEGPHPELAEALPAEARLITAEALYEMSGKLHP